LWEKSQHVIDGIGDNSVDNFRKDKDVNGLYRMRLDSGENLILHLPKAERCGTSQVRKTVLDFLAPAKKEPLAWQRCGSLRG
jgi:hypothetical protein